MISVFPISSGYPQNPRKTGFPEAAYKLLLSTNTSAISEVLSAYFQRCQRTAYSEILLSTFQHVLTLFSSGRISHIGSPKRQELGW